MSDHYSGMSRGGRRYMGWAGMNRLQKRAAQVKLGALAIPSLEWVSGWEGVPNAE